MKCSILDFSLNMDGQDLRDHSRGDVWLSREQETPRRKRKWMGPASHPFFLLQGLLLKAED